jgi:hypothetical protein
MAGIGRRCTLPLIMQDGLIAEQRGRPLLALGCRVVLPPARRSSCYPPDLARALSGRLRAAALCSRNGAPHSYIATS